MRLTDVVKKDGSNEKQYPVKHGLGAQYVANQKLGQHEDIEDELGIDLITLFKALKNGVYAFENGKIYKMNIVRLDSQDKENIILFRNQTYGGHCYSFKDYGKTWALSREELE